MTRCAVRSCSRRGTRRAAGQLVCWQHVEEAIRDAASKRAREYAGVSDGPHVRFNEEQARVYSLAFEHAKEYFRATVVLL